MTGLRLAVYSAVLFLFLPKATDAEMLYSRVPVKPQDPELRQALMQHIAADELTTSDRFERLLSPIFDTLPKNSHGRLNQDSVQYALRRVLSQASGFTLGSVQDLILDDFATRFGGMGCDLSEVAMLAEAAEQLLDVEGRKLLEAVYRSKRIAVSKPLRGSQLQQVLETYMSSFLQGQTSAEHALDAESFQDSYAAWPRVRDSLFQAQSDAGLQEFTFDEMVNLLRVARQSLVQLHHEECRSMEGLLADLEEGQSGRLPLSDFQQMALFEGQAQFSESFEALLRGGSLDMSDAKSPRLIIPNYVASGSNCIAQSGSFSICCPDACGSVLSFIEEAVGKEAATPAELASIVEDLPVHVPGLDDGLLSPSLLRKLQDVAKLHGGRVPLRGEAFAQWLHLLSPRACALPQSAASLRQAEEAAAAASSAAGLRERAADRLAAEEELFVTRPTAKMGHAGEASPSQGLSDSTPLCSGLVFVAAAVATAVSFSSFSSGSKTRLKLT